MTWSIGSALPCFVEKIMICFIQVGSNLMSWQPVTLDALQAEEEQCQTSALHVQAVLGALDDTRRQRRQMAKTHGRRTVLLLVVGFTKHRSGEDALGGLIN